MKKYPNTRLGWHYWFAKRFDVTESHFAEQMACWYLFLHLAFGETRTKP